MPRRKNEKLDKKPFAVLYKQLYMTPLAQDWKAMVTFEQFLILADYDGVVDLSFLGIHDITGVPIDILQAGVAELIKPNPHPYWDDVDCRRLEPLQHDRDFGWRITNYAKYSVDMFKLVMNEQQRIYQQRQRQKKKRPPSERPVGRPPSVESIMTKPDNFKFQRPRSIPDNFFVTPKVLEWAMKHKYKPDPKLYLEEFKSYFSNKGTRYIDWDVTFMNWIRNSLPGGRFYSRVAHEAKNTALAPSHKPFEPPKDTTLSLQAELTHAKSMIEILDKSGKNAEMWLKEVARLEKRIEILKNDQ